jgi:RNA polymerase sigma-70 factor (ECF subfamily)
MDVHTGNWPVVRTQLRRAIVCGPPLGGEQSSAHSGGRTNLIARSVANNKVRFCRAPMACNLLTPPSVPSDDLDVRATKDAPRGSGWREVASNQHWKRETYERFGRVIFRRARFLLRDDDAAKDVLQEILLRVATDHSQVLEMPEPERWLRRVTTNHCLNRKRDERRHEELLFDHSGHSAAHVKRADFEGRVIVLDLLRRLPRRVRDVAIHYVFYEMTHDEIAAAIGISRRTVGNRLRTFRKHIRSRASSR